MAAHSLFCPILMQPKSIVDLDLGDGTTEKASGITLYTRNTVKMAEMGRETLQSALDAEIAMQS